MGSVARALAANFVVHGLAMLTMATLLLPCLPGGTHAAVLERAAALSAHPWLFRAGWWPWHACALADLWLAVVLAREPSTRRPFGLAALALTLPGIVADQGPQLCWVTEGVGLASACAAGGDCARYARFEVLLLWVMSGLAPVFYTGAALCWSFALRRAGVWSRAFARLTALTWSAMGLAALAMLVPAAVRPPAPLVAALNALGFLAMQGWFALAWWLCRRAPEGSAAA